MRADEMMELTRNLASVAMGRTPADLVIRNGQWVCVQSGEILPKTDIAIKDGHIAYVGPDASHTISETTKVIDAGGRYLSPGLVDAHMHVESGMLTVSRFVQAVIPHGTTAMMIDPHEIGNIFGLKGVRMFVDEAAQQPIHVWVQMPSCVPSAPGLETTNATIGPAEVAEAMKWEGIIGLGEMMNFTGVASGDWKPHAEMAETRAAGKVIGGHYASPDLGLPFHGYAASGPADDHEGTTVDDAVTRVRQGMKAMLRQGSAWLDVESQIKAVTERNLDPRGFILCSDDSHCETLVNEGHVNRAVQAAIDAGLNPLTAIQMATINAAEHFNLGREIGQIAPGRWADILILPTLERIQPDIVIARGQVAAENGKLVIEPPTHPIPVWALNSVHIKNTLTEQDFRLTATASGLSEETTSAIANVIGITENQASTRKLRMKVRLEKGEVQLDPDQNLAKIAVVERHQSSGRISVGLVSGFNLQPCCAIATTMAHDSHNLIVAGTDDTSMTAAVNELAQRGGGQIVVLDGQVIGFVGLPIGGIISNADPNTVAQQAQTILDGFRACGCGLNNPNMQLSLLALPVIPELRITDLGLVDVEKMKCIPVLEANQKEGEDHV